MVSKLAGIVETITSFFQQLVDSSYLTLDYIFYISLALELFLIIFFLIKSSYSYELRLDRSLDGLNRWLYYNQYLDETNLIEFNNKIKKAPKLLRYHWQQYMLYREKEPSHYMSAYNCIEKPLRTSSFSSNIKNLLALCYTLAGLTFTLNFASFAATSQNQLGYMMLNSLLTPIAIIMFATFFSILLRSWQNTNLAGLYQNFHLFTRYIDKACTSLPEYIDFEVLFTKDEIKRGIPVLNEFLEKRARQEQKELEEAMLNSVDHEDYDFSNLGLSGSQILDRAMRETEIYLNQRQRTLSEIQQLESEIESAKRNYENNQKEFQRKMQASKENIERLRKQQEESTNRIESNYIRKQQTDEIKKQEQLEKDYESVTLRFNQDINTLSSEIKSRREDLEEKKKIVEDAMHAEYETFSTRAYKELRIAAQEKEKDEKDKIVEEKESYLAMLEEANQLLAEKDRELKKLHNIISQNEINLGKHGEFYDENLRKEERQRKRKDLKITKNSPVIEEFEEILNNSEAVQQAEISPQTLDEPQYDEFGGYYDAEGYYRYRNGTYYDPEGNFHDEFGGYYDKDGNYFPPQTTEQAIEQTPVADNSTPQYDEFGGYYDAKGYYRYRNGTYYDPEGNFHDEFGGHYDKDGNYFPPQTTEQVKAMPVEPIEVKVEQPVEVKAVEKPVEVKAVEEPIEIKQIETKPAERVEVKVVEEPIKAEVKTPEEPQAEDEAPKRGRGRPRKVTTDDEDDSPVQTEVKRGRGRPRKEDTAATEQVIEDSPKRGRGRPRKEDAVVVEQAVEEQKRSRGRPKKEDALQEPAKETTAEKELNEPIKRGRPKKEETTSPKARARRGKALKKKTPTPTKSVSKPKTVSKPAETKLDDELKNIFSKINLENENLKQQHEELLNQINTTLNEIDNSLPNPNSDDNASSGK